MRKGQDGPQVLTPSPTTLRRLLLPLWIPAFVLRRHASFHAVCIFSNAATKTLQRNICSSQESSPCPACPDGGGSVATGRRNSRRRRRRGGREADVLESSRLHLLTRLGLTLLIRQNVIYSPELIYADLSENRQHSQHVLLWFSWF